MLSAGLASAEDGFAPDEQPLEQPDQPVNPAGVKKSKLERKAHEDGIIHCFFLYGD
jgi:hypothetical protein